MCRTLFAKLFLLSHVLQMPPTNCRLGYMHKLSFDTWAVAQPLHGAPLDPQELHVKTRDHAAGFFADKDADAKARGEDTKKKSKEEQFSDFMSSIAVDVLEASSDIV